MRPLTFNSGRLVPALLTPDERLVMETTLALHGFALYQQHLKSQAKDRWMIIGPVTLIKYGNVMHTCVQQWMTGEIADYRALTSMSRKYERHDWSCLTDQELWQFHDTVVSTC
jgi:hypothetical protein